MLEPVIAALGWTLLHSLWQGLALALLVGLALVVFRNHRPVVRHGILAAGLIAVPVFALITFYSLFSTSQPATMVWSIPVHLPVSIQNQMPLPVVNNMEQQLHQLMPYLVGLWLLGVGLFSLRSLGGYWLTRRMLVRGGKTPGPAWQQTLNHLSQSMGLTRHVSLLVSTVCAVPLVIGHLKPVILMPIGILCSLSHSEVEAILLHELGHIKRNDYLLNLIQSLLETVFFYNPTVWWFSAQLRSERELCCDDMAVAISNDPMTFARALAHLQEVNMQVPFGAMAATGRGTLFSRIKRLVKPDEQSTGPFQSLFTITLVTFGVLLMARYTGTLHASPLANQTEEQTSDLDFLEPLIPKDGEGRVNFSDGSKEMTLQFDDFKLVDFQVNGKKKALSEVVTYRKEIEGIIVKLTQQNEKAENLQVKALKMEEKARAMQHKAHEMELAIVKAEVAAKELEREATERGAAERATAERERQSAQLESNAAEMEHASAKLKHEVAELERVSADSEQEADRLERHATELKHVSKELKRDSAELERVTTELKVIKELKAKPNKKSKEPKQLKTPKSNLGMNFPENLSPAIAPVPPTPQRLAGISPTPVVVPVAMKAPRAPRANTVPLVKPALPEVAPRAPRASTVREVEGTVPKVAPIAPIQPLPARQKGN